MGQTNHKDAYLATLMYLIQTLQAGFRVSLNYSFPLCKDSPAISGGNELRCYAFLSPTPFTNFVFFGSAVFPRLAIPLL